MFRFLKAIFGRNTQPIRRRARIDKTFAPMMEALENRLVPASISLDASHMIQIVGYDDADYGETVKVDVNTRGTSDPHDDYVNVYLTSQRGDMNRSFPLFTSSGGQWTQNVFSTKFQGLAGNDAFFNNTAMPSIAEG